MAFGVADGVGGWREHGVDPGEFSRTVRIVDMYYSQLVENVNKSIVEPVADKSDIKQKAIAAAEKTCAVALGNNNQAYFYNIGDSGLYVLRYEQPKTSDGEPPSKNNKEWCIHDFTPKQCHNFNFPFQLGKGADNVRKC